MSYDAPSSISIYTDSFEHKDAVADCTRSIMKMQMRKGELSITTTHSDADVFYHDDYRRYFLCAGLLCCDFIDCILYYDRYNHPYLRHGERTKEIGILRALGASKRNISQVFNAETFVIGCCAGLLGIGISLIALIPISSIIQSGDQYCRTERSAACGFFGGSRCDQYRDHHPGGLLPAKKAANKDPVIAPEDGVSGKVRWGAQKRSQDI